MLRSINPCVLAGPAPQASAPATLRLNLRSSARGHAHPQKRPGQVDDLMAGRCGAHQATAGCRPSVAPPIKPIEQAKSQSELALPALLANNTEEVSCAPSLADDLKHASDDLADWWHGSSGSLVIGAAVVSLDTHKVPLAGAL